MKNVLDVLREKRAQLTKLQEEVRALEIAAPMLAEEADKLISTLNQKSKLSQPEMIRFVLLANGRPMQSAEISDAIVKKYKGKPIRPEYITATIYRLIKKHKFFVKADAPNTFGLLEWSLTGTTPQPIQPTLRIVETK